MNTTETERTKPNPGSEEALAQGCICPVLDNGYGRQPDPSMGGWVYNLDCPLHNPKVKA